MPSQLIQEGGGAGDLVLLRMERKGDRRQVETGAAGIWRRSSGVSIKKQIQTDDHEVSPGLFRIQPASNLDSDEFGFYQFRGDMLPPYFYDFSTYWEGGN